MGLLSWFGFWIFVLYCLPVATGQSQRISSPQPITAQVGDDVILPCHLDRSISASSMEIEWTKPGLDPEYIHVHQDGRLVYQSQNPLFKYRTALFVDQLINGDASLKLYRVKNSDAGRYRCFIPSLGKEAFVQLRVEVSSMTLSKIVLLISFPALLVLLVIISVVKMVWFWKGNKTVLEVKTLLENKQDCKGLDAEPTEVKTLLENKQDCKGFVATLMEVKTLLENRQQDCEGHDAELMEVKIDLENKKKDCEGQVATLKEVETGLKNQRYQIKLLLEKGEKEREVNKKKLQAVEKEITEKEKTFEKPEELLREKENLLKEQWKLDETKKNNERQLLNVEKLLEPIEMQIAMKH